MNEPEFGGQSSWRHLAADTSRYVQSPAFVWAGNNTWVADSQPMILHQSMTYMIWQHANMAVGQLRWWKFEVV